MRQTSHLLHKLSLALAALVAMTGPAVQAARPNFAALKPAPPPPPAPSPRPMPAINQAALRQPPLPIAAPPTARGAASLSRRFALSRSGYPPNQGFAAGTGRATTLQPGTIIGRKGSSGGSFTTRNWAPKPGTLGLDPKSDREPVKHYRVLKPLDAVAGKAAPALGAKGGANQLKLPAGVNQLEANGILSRTARPAFTISAGRK